LSTVTIRWINDETVEVDVNGVEVASVNHDEHGWAGMGAVLDTARKMAKALGVEVREEGTPNL
jgi:hypothetical protein